MASPGVFRQCMHSFTSLNQSFSHLKPEFHMGESFTCCHLAIGKIGIDERDISKVKKNSLPPLFWVVVEAVVGYQLVRLVHATHELVVFVNHCWFLNGFHSSWQASTSWNCGHLPSMVSTYSCNCLLVHPLDTCYWPIFICDFYPFWAFFAERILGYLFGLFILFHSSQYPFLPASNRVKGWCRSYHNRHGGLCSRDILWAPSPHHLFSQQSSIITIVFLSCVHLEIPSVPCRRFGHYPSL